MTISRKMSETLKSPLRYSAMWSYKVGSRSPPLSTAPNHYYGGIKLRRHSNSDNGSIPLPGSTNPKFCNCQPTAALSEPGLLCEVGLNNRTYTSEGCRKAIKKPRQIRCLAQCGPQRALLPILPAGLLKGREAEAPGHLAQGWRSSQLQIHSGWMNE